MRNVGKQAGDKSGKYPVNEDDEEILRMCARSSPTSPASSNSLYRAEVFSRHASAAKQSIARHNGWMDCFVACAPLRKCFAFVAGNDDSHVRVKTQMPGTSPGMTSSS
jgi:hypothetical protein